MSKRLLSALLLVFALGVPFTAAADASPVWRFNGTELTGFETIAGSEPEGRLFLPGLTTKCKTKFQALISNNAGTGRGKVTEWTFENCSTSSAACSVEVILTEKFPWEANLITVSTSNYLVIKGIKILIVFSGKECALGGKKIIVTGSAGGLYTNSQETITFSSSTYPATGTELTALGSAVEWKGVLSTEATGSHHGEALTVS
jgi:hypothetical protein